MLSQALPPRPNLAEAVEPPALTPHLLAQARPDGLMPHRTLQQQTLHTPGSGTPSDHGNAYFSST